LSFKLSRMPGEKVNVVPTIGGGFEIVEDFQPEPSRTDEATDARVTPPAGRLPVGYMWVWNRLGKVFEKPYDAVPQIWEPYEFKVYPEDIARWLHAHTILTEDSFGQSAVRALAIEGMSGWLEPLGDFSPFEHIDRSQGDNKIGWGTGGVKTKAQAMQVAGTRPENFPNY